MTTNTSLPKSSALDMCGIGLSVLCAIHCGLTPLIILFLPSLGSFFENEYMHTGLFVLILPTAIFSFLRCYKLHKDIKVLILGAIALLFLLAGLFAESLFHSHSLEHTFSIIGSCTIILAHILNIRHCHCMKKNGGHCGDKIKEKEKEQELLKEA